MLLGVDCGQTRLKAVVFDDRGRELGQADQSTAVETPTEFAAERDMVLAQQQLDKVIESAMAAARVSGRDIAGVGIVAHGDGLYPIDDHGVPTRPAILAMDGRAATILRNWDASGVLGEAVALTGQQPHAGSLAPLLSWWAAAEPETLAKTHRLLYCKDWLRYTLTGDIATDVVEASASVSRRDGSGYSTQALASYGLADLAHLLPPIRRPSDIAGTITTEAAARTGLRAGTPVVTGTHDVVASALGTGCTEPGDVSVQAGTYSVNQLIWHERVTDPRWQARPWVSDGQWVLMGASPSSASNLDWFIRRLMSDIADPLKVANAEVAHTLPHPTQLTFHPFLAGSPYGAHASAAFLGLRAWHGRPDLLRAVFEGVVFNHRMHLDALAELSTRQQIHLSGGASHSAVWAQMFADILNCEVAITDCNEHGALGAAMLAGIGVGLYADVAAATAACIRDRHRLSPDPTTHTGYAAGYRRYQRSIDLMKQLWSDDPDPDGEDAPDPEGDQ
jgi:L-xylulokinase